jgi:hypothetical protein
MALKEISCYSLSECLRVQMDGTNVCDKCDLFGTDSCGGQDILKNGKNKKGYSITGNGLNNKDEPQKPKKKKRK